jgi:hypothetical protein
MAKPRSLASVWDEAGIFSSLKSILARVARKLEVSSSMASKVVMVIVVSPKIKKVLLEELEDIKQKLHGAPGVLVQLRFSRDRTFVFARLAAIAFVVAIFVSVIFVIPLLCFRP